MMPAADAAAPVPASNEKTPEAVLWIARSEPADEVAPKLMAAPVEEIQRLDENQRKEGEIVHVLQSRASENITVHNTVEVQRKISVNSIVVSDTIQQHVAELGHHPIEEGPSAGLSPRISENFGNCHEQEDVEAGLDLFPARLHPDCYKNDKAIFELAYQYVGNYMQVGLFCVCRVHGGLIKEEPDPGGTLSDLGEESNDLVFRTQGRNNEGAGKGEKVSRGNQPSMETWKLKREPLDLRTKD